MDRYWLLTWRTYSSWLPGKEGFVGYYRTLDGHRDIDNILGTPATEEIPNLRRSMQESTKGPAIFLSLEQAGTLLKQFHETAVYRGWKLDAVAVMSNHVHLAFGVDGDPNPSDLLRDFKSYASRALNRLGPKLHAPRWFADGGSKRLLINESSRIGAIQYVRNQNGPLLVWLSDEAAGIVDNFPGEPATSVAWVKTYLPLVATTLEITYPLFMESHPGD